MLRKGRCRQASTHISSRLPGLAVGTEAITRTVSSCNSPAAEPCSSAPIRLEDLPLPDVLVGPKPPVKEAISDTQMSTG